MYRISRFTIAVCALLTAVTARAEAQANQDREGVRRAVLDYVEGFYEGDTTKLVRSIHPDVQKFGFYVPRDSAHYVGEAMPWTDFLGYARRVRERGTQTPATAPKEVAVFDVQDQTASAKLAAAWGTDYLLLGKHDGRWMIRMVLWQTPPRPNGQ